MRTIKTKQIHEFGQRNSDTYPCSLCTKIAFQIFDEPVDFTWVEKGRVDSLEWADHKPGGGDVKVFILIHSSYNFALKCW